MANGPQCPQCGSTLTADAPQGLCPACLLREGLARSGDDKAPTADPGFSRATAAENTPTITAVAAPGVVTEGAAPRRDPMAMLAPGRQFGPYVVVRLLGRGGMGEVYEAEERENGRRVAIKLCNRPLEDAVDRERFLREGRLAAAVSHPNTVYVFGTQEIEGVPVIAMELAPGGTLKDRVKDGGPMATRAAVDTMLQVVAGLEAAAAAGVLHRDIKPANCFVDRDGRVKVGDFGLSISSLARLPAGAPSDVVLARPTSSPDDTHLTTAGAILGTPAFASPEQLRGLALDVRSDIYSVGATLYYLLTGHAPFEDPDLTVLIHKVVHEPPPSVQSQRRGIPEPLAAIVRRCLSKDPDARFADYDELAAALGPFAPSTLSPAPLGLRLIAGVIDGMIVTVPAVALLALGAWLRFQSARGNQVSFGVQAAYTIALVVSAFLPVAYFALLEGLTGMSVGKRLCGLRVTGLGGDTASFRRILARSAIYVGLGMAGSALIGPVARWSGAPASLAEPLLQWLLPLALRFSTARPSNGWAGLHELASRSRVYARGSADRSPRRTMIETGAPPRSASSRIGPYRVIDDTPADGLDAIVTGWDDVLRRNVWIHVAAGSDSLSPSRRDLARPTRVHWLAGRREGGRTWNAFEAVGGRPFHSVIGSPQPWQVVRRWLADLAREIDAARRDGTLPALTLDRLFVGHDGRIRLLDWPPPSSAAEARLADEPTLEADVPSAQAFLHGAVVAALGGGSVRLCDLSDSAPLAAPIPLRAATLLRDLSAGRYSSEEDVVRAVDATLAAPAVVPRRRRVLHLILTAALPLGFVGVGVLTLSIVFGHGSSAPSAFELTNLLWELNTQQASTDRAHVEQRDALEVYIAGRYRDLFRPGSEWPSFLTSSSQATVRRILAAHPNVSPDEARLAARRIVPLLVSLGTRDSQFDSDLSAVMPAAAVFAWALFGIVAIVSSFAARGGLLLRALGMAVVTADGLEASRLRCASRAVVAWLPLLPALALTRWPSQGGVFGFDRPEVIWLLAALFVAGGVYAIARPSRGLQDRLAGTYLVPR